ncbi:serine protease 48-like [Drosophila gunungcola]|uniref:serine protease 48-like n=1 Tax=Drosophila gunungcola TaxID=103775 RepID=UPI0022E251CA|nr:serine protease 48-like [Drosophila gunungcola]
MCQVQLLGVLITILQINHITGQNLPSIACPDIFQYQKYGNEYKGLLKLFLNKDVENEMRVDFSQPGRTEPDTPGYFGLSDDEESVILNLINNKPISFKIDFPTPGVVPKLTMPCMLCRFRLSVAPPSITLTLTRSLGVSIPWNNPHWTGLSQGQEPPQRSRPQQLAPSPRPQQVPQLPRLETTSIAPPTPPLSPPVQPTKYVPRTIGQLSGVCGREKTIQTPFIHNGIEVKRGQLPWMAALFELVGRDYNFLCGGTLISSRTVISAAHCFRFGSRSLPAERTTVSLGRISLDLISPGKTSGVSLLLLHQDYNPNVYTDADLALLQLTENIQFNDYIKPICLWNENFLLDLPSGYKSYVAGWGEDEKGNRNTRLAKMTDTDIITHSECRGNLSEENARFITSHTICASNAQASGPCSGDSGGGLMLQEEDIWMLRGVVSAGQRMTNRCNLTLPVIYTDVAKHIEWLLGSMWF